MAPAIILLPVFFVCLLFYLLRAKRLLLDVVGKDVIAAVYTA